MRALHLGLISAITLGCCALAGCASTDEARQAAGIKSWPACTDGFATECVVSLPTTDPIFISNGTTVIFARDGKPIDAANTTRICWTDEGDVDPTTCVNDINDMTELPEWLSFEPVKVSAGGATWPSLSIRGFETTDSAGELFIPFPLLIDVNVETSGSVETVNLEVACCDAIPNESANS